MPMLIVMVATVLVAAAWWVGKHRDAGTATVDSFQVHGSSMAPTLLGNHAAARCQVCGIGWKVDVIQQPGQLPKAPCSHCGGAIQYVDPGTSSSGIGPQADLVKVHRDAQLKRGDMVAVRWGDRIHVKRLAALAGDLVEIDKLQLTVNGERLEDQLIRSERSVDLPEFVVDIDSRRADSRWIPADPNGCWKRPSKGQWVFSGGSESTWLVYQHRSAHDHNRSSPVWDDYPFNIGLNRTLQQVDRFALRGQVESGSPTTLTVAFWSRGGNVMVRVPVDGKKAFSASYYDSVGEKKLPVSPEKPVAIQVENGPVTLTELSIQRWIEYRLRPQDDRSAYPLRVEEGTCFVLGDNVPASVDSRDIGLIPIENILGVVSKDRRPKSGQRE